MTKQRSVLVIGSGIAGLVTAIRASKTHRVTLVTKTALGDGSTLHAQGGVAAALFPDDSPSIHADDTLRVGGGLNSRSAVDVLCREGPARVRDLIDLGVAFDREGGQVARGREAAHSRARVAHAGGDRTGAEIQAVLVAALRASPVTILEHVFARELLVDAHRVVGAVVQHPNGAIESLEADAVVLATGGGGQLYSHTSNPSVSTADGVALALRAGAVLRDLEFYQFHPTTLAMPGNFLISEAVRGEGAVLVDAAGRRFMAAVHPDAELAPRDVLARGIARRAAAQGDAPILLDATGLGAAFLTRRFPGITAETQRLGLDWLHDPIPVTPAAHYWMGGVRTGEWGRTSMAGLFAVGEVACTGVHGANRLASNSLLEGLVFGWRCADALDDPSGDLRPDDSEPSSNTIIVQPQIADTEPVDRTRLQSLMWRSAGLFRDEQSLSAAATQLAGWHVEAPPSWATPSEGIEAAETQNLLDVARATVAAALARRESRGAHFRSDFPQTVPSFARHLDVAEKATVPC